MQEFRNPEHSLIDVENHFQKMIPAACFHKITGQHGAESCRIEGCAHLKEVWVGLPLKTELDVFTQSLKISFYVEQMSFCGMTKQ